MSSGSDRVKDEELIQARRALLTTPLMGPDHNSFRLVNKHSKDLTTDMERTLGYQLKVKRDVARLQKTTNPGAEIRPLKIPLAKEKHTDKWRSFTRTHYILFCLTLAALDRGGSQATIEWIAQRIISRSREADLGIDFDKRDHRVALGEVIAYLEHIKVLEGVDVNTQDWIRKNAGDSSLYNVNRALAGEIIVAPKIIGCQDSEDIIRASELAANANKEPSAVTRQMVCQKLAEEPVVYLSELSQEERNYYRGRERSAIDQELSSLLDLKIERHEEGTALVDRTFNSEKAMSDLRLPHRTRARQIAVLLAGYIKQETQDGKIRLSRERLKEECARLIEKHFDVKTDRALKSAQALDQALQALKDMKMIADQGQEIQALPLLAIIASSRIETKDSEEENNV